LCCNINQLLDYSLNQDFLQKIRKLVIEDQKKNVEQNCEIQGLERLGSRSWNEIKDLTFLVRCNDHLPSFTPTSPTPLGYKNEEIAAGKHTRENTSKEQEERELHL